MTLFRIAGFAEHRELQLMVAAGLSPSQAITTATHNAAELLGLHDRAPIAAGNLADFLVLEADLLSDIRNTEKIAVVWHRGRMIGEPIAGAPRDWDSRSSTFRVHVGKPRRPKCQKLAPEIERDSACIRSKRRLPTFRRSMDTSKLE